MERHGTITITDVPLSVNGINQSPAASVTVNGMAPSEGSVDVTVNQPVQFAVSSSDPDGTIGFPVFHWAGKESPVKQIWNFGEPVTPGDLKVFAPQPVHTYSSTGVYPVKVRVIDNLGAETTIEFGANMVPYEEKI